MNFAAVCAQFRRRSAPVSIETRAILRVIRRDFGAHDASVECKRCAIIEGSRWPSFRRVLEHNFDCAVHFARKIHNIVDENRTSLRWFLQSFGVLQARCECTTQADVVFDVLKMS